MLPFLDFLKDKKEHSLPEAKEHIYKFFKLTEGEKRELLPSGRQAIIVNRIGWARTYLKKAGLLESPRRGFYKITERGLNVINESPSKISNEYLARFPEFVQFKTTKKKRKTEPQTKITDSLDPVEILETSRFSIEKLLDFDYLKRNFKNWLLFRNNLSWTTLHRTGYKALEDPARLAKLIMLLQNEDLDVGVRVRRGLKGEEKVIGIGPGILTGLLHTFFDDKYCVWNRRTKETLEILRLSPTTYRDSGYTYKAVNEKLHEMSNDLNTDLATIDGFMWFISKHVTFL